MVKPGIEKGPTTEVALALGERFAAALAAKDIGELKNLMSADVTLRGLTPGRYWEAHGPDQAIDVLFGNWFEDGDRIRELVSVNSGRVEDRYRVTYRLLVTNEDGDHHVEQHAYFDVDADSRISWMSTLCSGYRSIRG